MRRFFTFLFIACCISATAQTVRTAGKTALEEISGNRFLAGGNNADYDRLPRDPLTPTPKGYEPYYLSHYGRHGSRWLLNDRDYGMPVKTLTEARDSGKLTLLGEKTLVKLDSFYQTTKDHLGDLTPVGERQHHGIGKRMTENFPEIFKVKNVPINAISTTSVRAILSMMAECEELAAANPTARIHNEASRATMYYMNASKTDEMRKLDMKARQVQGEYETRHPDRLMQTLFNDQDWVKAHVDAGKLMSAIYDIANNMQSHDGDDTLLSLFTNEELVELWHSGNLYWYLGFANAPQTENKMPFAQKNLLLNIIETADTVTQTQATLRFGHDTVVLPLASLMDLDGSGVSVDDLNELDKYFRNYLIIPTACNVQMIFYRPVKGKKGDILVKVLLNEREAHMPMETDMWPYYKWSVVRQYYLDKLSE